MINNWLKNIEFAYPLALGLFIFLPILIWWHIKNFNQRQSSIIVSSVHPFTVSSWKTRFRHLLFITRILALSCLIVALARPQRQNIIQKINGEGVDIMLCMDVSGSMGSKDILPSRLEAAKEVAIQFVQNRPVDRIGLVIFSGESFTQCPLTTDKNSLIEQIQSLESRKYLADGTVIGEGLAMAADHLSKTESKTKIIILLTDGKEDAPATRLIDPITALNIVKAKKIKVYTIGMGAAPSTIIEITNQPKGKNNAAINLPDEELLQRIANETGGQYFRARDREGLKNIYQQIDTMEKSKVVITSDTKYEEEFMPFLLAALGLLTIEIILKYSIFRKFP
ncbi:MAG TPA: VWA domain-containing protein [Chitinophagaceae bacterium]|nr:VWA domain-containing protein [Chitinophagaceae bacterium]